MNLKTTGSLVRGWAIAEKHPGLRKTEEITITGCDRVPEPLQDSRMNDSGENRKETTDRKIWNVTKMYETGKLIQVTAEIRHFHIHIF